MAKILIASDTHGNKEQFKQLISENEFTHIIFCGDLLKDVEDINHNNLIKVKGNWDEWFIDNKNKLEEVVEIEGVKIIVTHGHKYGVKSGLGGLIKRAEQEQAKIVCYGHTHIKDVQEINGVLYINPGAFSYFKGGKHTYVTIEIADKKIIVNS